MAIKAVLDTNVFISGLIVEQGAPRQVIDAWLAGEYTLVTSSYLIDELKHVLTYPRITKRLRLSDVELGAIFHSLSSQAEITPGQYQLPGITRDPKDDAVIACAHEGEAGYVVSGDQDILTLGEYQGIHMVTPAQFTEILAAGDNDVS